jgi:hypothetical protein
MKIKGKCSEMVMRLDAKGMLEYFVCMYVVASSKKGKEYVT